MNYLTSYTNMWKRKHKKLTLVKLDDIILTEEIHQSLSRSIKASLRKQINGIGDDSAKDLSFTNYHRNNIVVRPAGHSKYALVSGHVSYEALKMKGVESARIRIVNAVNRNEWIKEMKRDYTIRPMISLDEIELSIKKPDQDEIREKIAYLVKNKDFDEPVVIDKTTLDDDKVKIYSGEYNALAAIALGIKDIRVMVPADGINDIY